MPSQLFGCHRRCGLYTRHDRNSNPQTLNRFDQGTKIAVAREKEQFIQLRSNLERVNGKIYTNAASRPPTLILKAFNELRTDGEPIDLEPVSETLNAAGRAFSYRQVEVRTDYSPGFFELQ